MDSLIPVLIIVALILLNGFFVAAEFALIGAPRAAIEHQAREGNKVARAIARMFHDARRQDQYIATAQLGITFASLGLGMYGEHVLAQWIAGWFRQIWPANVFAEHTLASVLALVGLTYFHIVVGEMVPKAVALQAAERTAMWITPPMSVSRQLLLPLVVILNGIGNFVLRIVGVERSTAGHQHYHSPEELEFVIQESQAGGALRAESSRVLQELLRFGELTAREIMTPRIHVVGLPLGADREEIANTLRESRHARYPVYEEGLDQIVGSVHIKDLLPLLLHGQALQRAHVAPVAFVPETSDLDVVLTSMRKERTQMAVVMDEHGGTAGMITTRDVFDEIVGPVSEDFAEADIQQRGDHLSVAGTVRLDELDEHLAVDLEHEQVDTVSGLVLDLLDRPPIVGDAVVYQGLRFRVVEVAGHGVGRCIVERLHQPPAENHEQG